MPHDIVTAACSAEWNWLKKTKNNQPEVAAAVVAKVAAVVVVAWQQLP